MIRSFRARLRRANHPVRESFPFVFVPLLAASFFASPAAAQQKGTVVTETARAVLIEIPVNVIGKDGQPVRGLTAADFELYDEGKKQTISGFEVIDLNAAPPPAAASPFLEPPPAAARRHFLLVFDLSYASPTGILRAREGAKSFVNSGLKENDLAAVATSSVEKGWKLLVNFTPDRRQLSRAIETLGLAGVNLTASDPLSFAFIPPAGDAGLGEEGPGGVGPGAAGGDAEFQQSLRDLQTLQKGASDDRARGRVAELLRSFEVMGRSLDSVRGRKHILYFSEGFESRLVAGNTDRERDPGFNRAAPETNMPAESSISGEVWKIDSDARFGSSATRGRLGEAFSVFARSDTVVHTIDITGLSAEGDVVEKRGSGKDALYTMAAETGGEFIRNANQLSGELAELQQRTGLTYLLVYQPQKLEKPGQFHRLRVKVKAAGARVSARSGYYEPKPYRALSPIERVLATGDMVTGGARRDDIPVHLLAAPFATEGKLAQVPVILEIPGTPLLAGNTENQASVEIYSYASDAKGTLTDYLTQTMALDLSKLRQTIEGGGIKFYGTLYLPPGDYTVRTLVRNSGTGRTGVEAAAVKVPAMPGGAATVLPPVFAEEPGRWAMVKGNPRAGAPPRASDYPFAIGGDSLIPSVLPTLRNGQEARVAVFTYNFAAGSKPPPLEVRAEIVGPDGKARPAALQMARESDTERGGGRKRLYTLKPEGLAPGRYTLKVAVSETATKNSSENFSFFEVR